MCVVCEVILHTDTVYNTKRERGYLCVLLFVPDQRSVSHYTTCNYMYNEHACTHTHTHLVLLFEDYNTEKSLNVSS